MCGEMGLGRARHCEVWLCVCVWGGGGGGGICSSWLAHLALLVSGEMM